MKSFDDRQKAFEQKFARDELLQFKVEATRNRLVALWASARLGLSDEQTDAYVKSVQAADMEEAGDGDVIRKIKADFAKAEMSIDDAQLRSQLDEALAQAKTMLMQDE